MAQSASEHYLRISGAKLEIPKAMSIGEPGSYDVKVRLVGDIVKEETFDKQDGTVIKHYILRPSIVELI
jgi:hypothetical protein